MAKRKKKKDTTKIVVNSDYLDVLESAFALLEDIFDEDGAARITLEDFEDFEALNKRYAETYVETPNVVLEDFLKEAQRRSGGRPLKLMREVE